MDIEEERKAFECYYSRNHGTPLDVLRTLRLGETYSIKANDNVRRAWETWLVAKAHATEMAKPTVKIMLKAKTSDTSYPFCLCLYEDKTFNGVLEDFKDKGIARQWAEDNGYRVIE